MDILLEVSHFARATYYYHEKRLNKADKYGDAKAVIAVIYHENKSMEHFKKELIDYLDYYDNRRGKAKLKGLPPAIHRQQALLNA
ncbi:MAG: IS3 family transposase [Oscillibacter ruminantium]|nr:IS3 family transposase [Oscillibacter ruminantium]MEA5042761.1 IS3 family transposase [Oscillibacter ruminantium]